MSAFAILLLVVAAPLCSGKYCPVWTTYNESTRQCQCRDLNQVAKCDQDTLKISLLRCYCMTYAEQVNGTVIGSCALLCNHYHTHICDIYNQFPSSDAEDLNEVCVSYNRTGTLCAKCLRNHSFPVYSYLQACVPCSKSDFPRNLVRYFCVAYAPLTLLYLAFVTFKISISSGELVGYVLSAQVLATPTVVRLFFAQPSNRYVSIYLLTSCLSIWNLDFFRSFYSPFCIHPDMTTLQVLALDYLVAVYPLFLIFLTYTAVLLHDRYSIVVKIWRPAYRVFSCIRREWNIRGSLIQAFATFMVLSYVKILNVSFDLLFLLNLTDIKGAKVGHTRVYNDAAVWGEC